MTRSQKILTHRSIRSFVLRQGHISNAQRRAHETLLESYGIPFSENRLNLEEIFNKNQPKFLEIGYGMGETTVAIAKACPQNDYIAIEVHTPGVGSLLIKIQELGLENLRIIQHDAVEVLQKMLPLECFDGIHIFFPDPWPKVRHRKRRLIQQEFISLLCKYLKLGGYIHVATDWEEYAGKILEIMNHEPCLVNTAQDYALRPEYRSLTKFEQRGLLLGHNIRDLIFQKNNLNATLT